MHFLEEIVKPMEYVAYTMKWSENGNGELRKRFSKKMDEAEK